MYLDFIYQGSNLLRNRLLCCLCTLLLCLPARAVADEWIYTVKPGDNLWNLSERHLTGVQYVQRLQQMNRIKDPYVIPPGKKLRIPVAWSQISDADAVLPRPVDGSSVTKASSRQDTPNWMPVHHRRCARVSVKCIRASAGVIRKRFLQPFLSS